MANKNQLIIRCPEKLKEAYRESLSILSIKGMSEDIRAHMARRIIETEYIKYGED